MIRFKNGFTPIELLVVIAIIGILASIVLTSVGVVRSKSRDVKRKADLHEIAKAINMYYFDNGYLPRNLTNWCTYVSNPTSGWGASFQSDLVPTYISKISLDPTFANQVGDYFYYNLNNTTGDYAICANLEEATGQNYFYNWCAGGTTYNYCVNR